MKYYLSIAAIFLIAGCAKPSYSNQVGYASPHKASQPVHYKPHSTTSYAKTSLECNQSQMLKKDAGISHVAPPAPTCQPLLKDKLLINVTGQGVAPANTSSPAQAYALAKRAAIADAYRLIAEKVKGVRVDGQDLIQDMMVKRSTVRTAVAAMIRNANIVETNYKEGLCEVSMEIVLSRSQLKL